MTWVYIIGAMVGLGLLSWLAGCLQDKHREVWRGIVIWAVFFGGLWLAAEGDHETLRGMAFFLPFALVFGIHMFLESVDREAAERRRNES